METKLKQLDAERDELAKYQAIDRECRSLEYAIHDKEVSDARIKLEEVQSQFSSEILHRFDEAASQLFC